MPEDKFPVRSQKVRPKKKKNEKLIVIQARISPELLKTLKATSKRTGENVSTVIRTALSRQFISGDKQWTI